MKNLKRLIFLTLSLFTLPACITQTSFVKKKKSYRPPAYHGNKNFMRWPLDGKVTSYYGERDGRFHHGIDIKGAKDENIQSVERGTVIFSGWKKGYGRTVIVKHKGYKTLYAHCLRLKVKKGQRVRKGQSIATVGISGRSSGYHLHFEFRTLEDRSINPMLVLKL